LSNVNHSGLRLIMCFKSTVNSIHIVIRVEAKIKRLTSLKNDYNHDFDFFNIFFEKWF
jgi:hypothetical protein